MLCLVSASPALAAESRVNFSAGLLNIIDILKYVLIVASVIAFVRELCTRRNIVTLLGLLFAGAAAFHFVEIDEFRRLGNGITFFFMEEVKISPEQGAGVESNKENAVNSPGMLKAKNQGQEDRNSSEAANTAEEFSPVRN